MYNPTLSLHSAPYLGRPVQRSVCEKQAHDEKHTKSVYTGMCEMDQDLQFNTKPSPAPVSVPHTHTNTPSPIICSSNKHTKMVGVCAPLSA